MYISGDVKIKNGSLDNELDVRKELNPGHPIRTIYLKNGNKVEIYRLESGNFKFKEINSDGRTVKETTYDPKSTTMPENVRQYLEVLNKSAGCYADPIRQSNKDFDASNMQRFLREKGGRLNLTDIEARLKQMFPPPKRPIA